MIQSKNILNKYNGKKVLVTGGTGFIGNNLINTLKKLGANITLVSRDVKSLIEGVELITGDIRDQSVMNKAVIDKEIIFNLAAQVSHMDKNIISYEDLDINCRGQLTLLEACRIHNPKVKIVFSSTRMVYGENTKNPIKETHSTNPVTIYGIHKLTAEKYHLAYNAKYNIPCTILRIGNPYGDGQHFSKGLYSMPGWFMNQAINNKTVEILSSGKQIRDYIYIGDLVETMLRVALSSKTNGQIYNCGTGTKHTFGEMLQTISNTVGSGNFFYSKKSPNHKIPIADSYCFDVSKLKKTLGWSAKTSLQEGIRYMYEYAKKYPNKT